MLLCVMLTGYGGGAGGIAYLGIFGDPRYATAFIFPKNLGPDYPKFMAEAVSHGERLLACLLACLLLNQRLQQCIICFRISRVFGTLQR
jgi:hypothetical protein